MTLTCRCSVYKRRLYLILRPREAHWHYTAEFFGFTIPFRKGWNNNLTRFWWFFGFTWFFIPSRGRATRSRTKWSCSSSKSSSSCDCAANRARTSALQASFQLRPLYCRLTLCCALHCACLLCSWCMQPKLDKNEFRTDPQKRNHQTRTAPFQKIVLDFTRFFQIFLLKFQVNSLL